MSDHQFTLLIAAVFIIAGGFMIWYGLRSRKLASASKTWPSTPGKIVTSWVRETESTDSENRTTTTYVAEVEYEYKVDGQPLQGNRVQFGLGGSGNSTALRAIVKRYPVGAEVQVFYDPAKPKQCTLEQKAAGSAMILLFLGVLFLVFAPCVTALVVFLNKD
jgi:hypothetical protein